MVSDASKKKAAQKKAAAAAKRGGKAAATSSKSAVTASVGSQNGVEKLADGVEALLISDRTCTGVLCSHPLSRDIRVSNAPIDEFKDSICFYKIWFLFGSLYKGKRVWGRWEGMSDS